MVGCRCYRPSDSIGEIVYARPYGLVLICTEGCLENEDFFKTSRHTAIIFLAYRRSPRKSLTEYLASRSMHHAQSSGEGGVG